MLHKIKFIIFSSLLLNTTIIYPLVSCSSDGSSNDIGGFDKEFGFDVQTYNRLENEFINKYKNQLLDNNNIDKNVAFDKYDNFLQNDITSLRNQLFDPTQNYSFTIRTNTLMDYASKNYNIYLNRNTNVSETDFSNLKQSSLENFIIYLDNVYGIENTNDKQKRIDNFSNKFDELLKQYCDKYIDKVEILMKLRASIVNCWDDLNDQFALLSAYNNLKDFFDDYQFIIKDQSNKLVDNNKLLWNNLLDDEMFITNNKTGLIDRDIDCPISDQWINNLFTISKKKNYSENNSLDYQDDSTSSIPNGYNEIHKFNSTNVIPGYTLTPVLKTMTQDIYANNYYMNIDWQLISNKYQDETNQKIKDNVTAHITYNKNGQIITDDDFKNGQLSSNNYQFTKYSLLATPTYQKQNLIKAYFDSGKEKNQKITFSWDKQKVGIEYFLPGNIYDNDFVLSNEPYDLSMTQDNLLAIGLQLNGTSLSDLIEKQKNSQSPNNPNNLDEKSKIEEKFVKYCTIDTVTTIAFTNNDVSNNKIQNTFTATYNNTKQECEISDIQEEAELKDIGASSVFNDNAVTFYNNVADYINTQKIEDEFIVSDKTSKTIQIELVIICMMVLFWLFLLVDQAFNGLFDNDDVQKARKISHPVILLVIFFTIAVIASIVWEKFVHRPFHENLTGIKNWNKKFANGLANEINIVKKVNDDKKYFKSSNDFDKYFHNDGSKAFASYFYYYHFNGLLSKDNETSIGINNEVIDDYNQFNSTKEKFIKSISKYETCNTIYAYSLVVSMVVMISLLVLVLYDMRTIENKLNQILVTSRQINLK